MMVMIAGSGQEVFSSILEMERAEILFLRYCTAVPDHAAGQFVNISLRFARFFQCKDVDFPHRVTFRFFFIFAFIFCLNYVAAAVEAGVMLSESNSGNDPTSTCYYPCSS